VPERLFARSDAARCGSVPRTRLRAVLENLGFRRDDEEQLMLAFADARMPEMFAYHRLYASLDGLRLTAVDLSRVPAPVAFDRELPRGQR